MGSRGDGGALCRESFWLSLLFIHPRASLLIFLARRRQYSSRCQPPRSGFCLSSLSFVTIGAVSYISMSRNIPRLSGARSRSSTPFRGIARLASCCGTGMESTGRTSNVASRDSASNRFSRRRARHGRAVRRTSHWKRSPRVPRPRDRPQRSARETNPARIRRLLSFLPDSLVARERCPRAANRPSPLDGASDGRSESRRSPSLLPSPRCVTIAALT